ncbi:MAG: ATP-binding protein [Oligoflexia bacterium]|nr:ATP-binding protein [Oligoflexia bacterium]
MRSRYLLKFILEDIQEKMVFLAGPRQVGKTTLSQKLLAPKFSEHKYYNWDFKDDRKDILSAYFHSEQGLIILDEIHKYKKWKNLVKGFYDKFKDKYNFFITGSARLDLYRRGSDSLMGRYHYFRLHPFSLSELSDIAPQIDPMKELIIPNRSERQHFQQLYIYGGFPEPLLKSSMRTLKRWHNERTERLFREDIRDTENIRQLDQMQILCSLLPSKVSSPISLNSLREDIEVGHRTVGNWIRILETFYYNFRIYPYSKNIARSLKKEGKLYLWDWSELENEGAKFENIIASHLLKTVHFLHDVHGEKCEMYYLRDREKREVDFLLTINGKPWMAIETKLSDRSPSGHLQYFKNKLNIPFCYQVIKDSNFDKICDGIRIISADKFLLSLP